MILTRIFLPGFVIHSFKIQEGGCLVFFLFRWKERFFFSSFLVLCERPGSGEQPPAERPTAARPPETQISPLRHLQGPYRASTEPRVCLFLYKSKPKKPTEGGLAVKVRSPLIFSRAQLAGSAIPAYGCA